MGELEGRRALVTGGARGIGRAIALALAAEGADVAINYVSSEAAAREVVDEVCALGRRSEAYRFDVADYDACAAATERLLADFGPIDLLVNNAGIGASSIGLPSVTEASLDDWRRLIGANLWGAVHMCKLLVPQMREAAKTAGRGDIVMISSIAAQTMGAGMATYSTGKAGMEALAMTLAKEERAHHIRSNVVAPGVVETDMGRKLMLERSGVTDMRELDARMPFGHVCQPEDIANAVRFLVSERGRYITGQRITVNGGGF